MIKAILIDDETHCLEMLDILLKDYCPNVQVLEQCLSAMKGIDAIERLHPDVVFLDIEMPAMNGFELIEHFKEIPFAIIFTTSYDQYAIKAFRLSALDYLLKPIDPDDLTIAVKKIEEQRHFPLAEQFQILLKKINDKNTGFTKIAVPTAEGFELIPSAEVLYLTANDNYTNFTLKSNRKIVACRTLKDMEQQLQDFSFFIRVHHSYLVNLNEVSKYVRGEGGYLVMSDGAAINVSRSRKDALLKFF
jgi:two-component system LytT family response regulator